MRISDASLDQIFHKARTANGFTDKPVPAALLQEVYDLARMGPTSMNCQPTRYVFLTTPQAKERLMPALMPGNVDKTKSAPVTVIVATDTRFYEHMPVVWHNPGAKEMFEGNAALAGGTATRNSTLGGAYFMVAARALGLDCGPMSGVDLAVSYRPEDQPRLWFEPLYNEALHLVVSASHPLARRRRVRMGELHQQRMVLLPRQFLTRQMLDDCFEAAGSQPQVVAELNSVGPMIELIRQTELAGIIPETAVTAGPDLSVIPLEEPRPMRTPGLLWTKGATRSPVIKHMADIIRRKAGSRR